MPLVAVAKASAASGRGARSRGVEAPMAEIRRAFLRLAASADVAELSLGGFAEHVGAGYEPESWPGADPLPWDAEAFRREIASALRDMVQAAGDYELGVAEREGHLAVVEKARAKLDTTDEQALAWIRQEAGALVEGMSQRKLKALRTLLTQATERGETPAQLGRRIVRDKLAGLLDRDVTAVENLYRRLIREGRTRARAAELAAKYRRTLLSRRAERIARTEMTKSWSAGQVAGWKQAQRDKLLSRDAMVEWLNGGANPCPMCLRLNGKRVKVGGTFYPGGYRYPGETHPNCLPGTVTIQSPSDVHGASQRHYAGNLIRIRTERGNELSCSPNHPILTHAGWIPASTLYVGCHVFSRGARERVLACDVNGQDIPAMIHEVAHALGLRERVLSVEVPVASEDFHGDGIGSEVAIVRANGDLVTKLDTERGDHLAQLDFEPRDVVAVSANGLAPERRAFLAGHRHATTSHGVVRGLDRMGAEGERLLAPGNAPLGAHAALLDAALPQAQGDGDPGYSEPSSEPEYAFPSDVAPDEVVSVDAYPFDGQVFNLQTASGWYLAEGIITHNCECLLVLVVDASRRRRRKSA